MLSATLIFFLSSGAYGETVKDPSPHSSVQIISEGPKTGTFWNAIELNAEEGWHSYWKNPGDTGLATKVQWELPRGFEVEDILWPVPERIETPPLTSYGYHGRVILPVRFRTSLPIQPHVALNFRAKVSWLICKEVCLPASETVTWSWPNALNSQFAGKTA
jgi:thiol:disulfide interchange protein DsbD